MPPPLVPTVDTGLTEAKRDGREAGGGIQAQRCGTRGASRPEGSGFELEPGGGQRPQRAAGSLSPGSIPSPRCVHTALSLNQSPGARVFPAPSQPPGWPRQAALRAVRTPRGVTPAPRPALRPVRTPRGVRPGLGSDTACLLLGQTSAQWRTFAPFSCLSNLTPFPRFYQVIIAVATDSLGRLAAGTTEVCPSFYALQICLPLGFSPGPLAAMNFSQTFGCLLYIHICGSVPFAPTPEPRPAQEGLHVTPHKFSTSSGEQHDPAWPAAESTFLPGGLGQDL